MLFESLFEVPNVCPASMPTSIEYCPGPGAHELIPKDRPPSVVPNPLSFMLFCCLPTPDSSYAPGPTFAAVCGFIPREEPVLTPNAPPAVLGR